MNINNGVKIVIAILIMSIVGSLSASAVSAAPSGYASYKFIPGRYYTFSSEKALITIYSDSGGLSRHNVVWKDPQGATVSCGNQCATIYTYSPNGLTMTSTWEFFIAGYSRPAGTYTASINFCTSSSGNICFSWTEIERASFYISDDPKAPVVAIVPLENRAREVDVNPSTNRVYVANGSDQVTVIDGATNTVISNITVGLNPWGVGVNPVTNRIYVSNNDDNNISVIDGTSNTVIGTIPVSTNPLGVAVNPNTNRIYVVNDVSGTVSVIDGTSDIVIASIKVGIGPRDVAVNPVTNRIYVANWYDRFISVIDGASNTIATSIPVPTWFSSISVNPNTNRIFAVGVPMDFNIDNITVVDGANNTIIKTEPVGDYPMGVGANPSTNHVFVGNESSLDVSMLSGASNTVDSTLPIARPAGSVAVNPTTNRIFVANGDGASVTVIDDIPSQNKIFLPVVVKPNP